MFCVYQQVIAFNGLKRFYKCNVQIKRIFILVSEGHFSDGVNPLGGICSSN